MSAFARLVDSIGGARSAAKVCGVDRISVYRWLRGARRPRPQVLLSLCSSCGVDPAPIFADVYGHASPGAPTPDVGHAFPHGLEVA